MRWNLSPWPRRALVGLLAFFVLFNLGGVATVRVQATAGDRGPTEEELLTPPPFRIALEEVSFTTSDGIELKGWFLPGSLAGPVARRAAILLLSGSGKAGHPYAAMTYGPVLAGEGYNVLAFSYRGHGRSGGATLGGTLVSLERLVDDAQAALRYLHSRPEVGAQPVGVLGCSLGTGVGLALAGRGSGVNALVLDSPWGDFPTSQETQAISRGQGWQNRIPYFWRLLRWWASIAFQVDLHRNEPLTALTRLQATPIFLIHGTADRLLSPRQSELLYAKAAGPKQLWMPEGVGHCEARYASDREFKAQVLAFYRRWLTDGSGPGFTVQKSPEVHTQGGEVTVTLTNESGESVPVAVSLHRPGSGATAEEHRLWLAQGPGEQTFTVRTDAPVELVTVLRHYVVQTSGESWREDLSPDALGWHKMKEAEALASQGRHREAQAAYQQARQIAPQNPLYSFQAGAYFFQRGMYDAASDAFFQAIALPGALEPGPDPRHWKALAFVYIGRTLDIQGDRRGALSSYRQALAFDIPLATRWAHEGLREPHREGAK